MFLAICHYFFSDADSTSSRLSGEGRQPIPDHEIARTNRSCGHNTIYIHIVIPPAYKCAQKIDKIQWHGDNLDLSSFPIVDSANQPHISSLKTDVSDGLWSPANIDSLIAGFSVVSEPESKHNTEQGAQIHHRLSKPNNSISKNPLETEAGRLWADFGRPKVQPVAEQEYSNSANSEKNAPQQTKRTKVGGKARCQPLKL